MNVLIIRIVTIIFSISFTIIIINSVNWKPKVIQSLEKCKKQDARIFNGIIDRIEEWATLLIEESYEELIVTVNDLPDKSKEGDILIINEYDDGYYRFYIEKL